MRGLVATCALALVACGARSGEPIEAREPTRGEMVRTLLAQGRMPLATQRHCEGAGTEPSDATLADYLSGFLSELKDDGGRNWIETSATLRDPAESGAQRTWACNVTVRRQKGEEEWGWGVSFDLRDGTRSVVPGTIVCTGAG